MLYLTRRGSWRKISIRSKIISAIPTTTWTKKSPVLFYASSSAISGGSFSFKGQKIFVGLDVHLRSWSVTVLSEQAVLKKFKQDPSPAALNKFLTNTYPDAEYYSVYEAGFCGFWIHWELHNLGINNIVVNPADAPTMTGERLRKTDAIDSGKLARSLRSGELKGIYVPDSLATEIRSLIRLRDSLTKDQTRHKNRFRLT